MKQQWYRWDGEDLILSIKTQPKSGKDQICEVQEGHLKIKITAPPIDGKANAHLIKFLAKSFGVIKSGVELERGDCSRLKRIRIIAPKKIPEELKKGLACKTI
ncbi:MAG: YggU family protein [Gammaproteobacteria bacterium]|nr:MAG: YggU family protein [Gammaproteobacteria bacterium]